MYEQGEFMKDWYFVHNENFITEEFVDELLETNDVIIPYLEASSNFLNFEVNHAVPKDYFDTYMFCLENNLCIFNNMFIMKPKVEEEFISWINSFSSVDDEQLGVLLYTWLLKSTYKVMEIKVMEMDPDTSEDAAKKVELINQYMRLNLSNPDDFVTNLSPTANLDDKIPVWVCWFQGRENAPELVKACLNSIENHLPKEVVNLQVIDLNNLFEYLSLPEWIIQKYNDGIIGQAHFSDIVRSQLLYLYGGMWIDATYYVANDIPSSFFTDQNFWTHRMKVPMWRADIAQGNFSCNLLYGKAYNSLFKFILNGLYNYWARNDKVIDYFFYDHIIQIAYTTDENIHKMIENVKYSNPDMFELKKIINNKYDEKRWNNIKSNTTFFKLTYRDDFSKQTIVDDMTLWGYISSNS